MAGLFATDIVEQLNLYVYVCVFIPHDLGMILCFPVSSSINKPLEHLELIHGCHEVITQGCQSILEPPTWST